MWSSLTAGEGNEAYGSYIEDLTVETGSGNAGAVGIDFLANNAGAIRNVRIKGSGHAGLSVARKWVGPCLVKNLAVEGFEYGIKASHQEYRKQKAVK